MSHLMRYIIRWIPDEAKLSEEFALKAIATAVPQSVVQSVVAKFGVARQRERKLPTELTMMLPIAMNIFTEEPLEQVLTSVMQGLRLIWPDPYFKTATKGAISRITSGGCGACVFGQLWHDRLAF